VVPAHTRWSVWAFLLVFAVAGVAHLEVFPFSGFKLFSALRPAERQSWQIRAVDPAGEERAIVLGDLPAAYQYSSLLLSDFDELSAGERDEICEAWAAPLRADGDDVALVRIYRVVDEVRPDDVPPRRTLEYECGRQG
jgi:hypothetical protein